MLLALSLTSQESPSNTFASPTRVATTASDGVTALGHDVADIPKLVALDDADSPRSIDWDVSSFVDDVHENPNSCDTSVQMPHSSDVAATLPPTMLSLDDFLETLGVDSLTPPPPKEQRFEDTPSASKPGRRKSLHRRSSSSMSFGSDSIPGPAKEAAPSDSSPAVNHDKNLHRRSPSISPSPTQVYRKSLSPFPPRHKTLGGLSRENSHSVESGLNSLGDDRGRRSPRARSASPLSDIEKACEAKANEQPPPVLTMKQTLAQSLNMRASSLFRAGNVNEALKIYHDALRVARSDFADSTSIPEEDGMDEESEDQENIKPSPPSDQSPRKQEDACIMLVKTLNSIAIVLWKQGKLEKSNDVLDEAMEVLDATEFGRTGLVLLRSKSSKSLGKKKGGSSKRRLSLEDRSSQTSAAPLSKAFDFVKCETLSNKGIIQFLGRNFKEAMTTFRTVLARQRSVLGRKGSHVVLARTREWLAMCYAQVNCLDEAVRILMEVLETKQAAYTRDSLSVAVTLCSLGGIHAMQQDFHLALAAYTEALRIQQLLLEPTHVDIGVTLHYIGRIQSSIEKFSDALTTFSKALAIYKEANLDDKNPIVMSLCLDTAQVNMKRWQDGDDNKDDVPPMPVLGNN